ncbi:type II secretion system F family protein [Botrimarina sp.]|uniref:type II secretion system F family protein n=1 Tax=Botrimarina sp. TaxID=2795802 RepID=UPI0032EFA706
MNPAPLAAAPPAPTPRRWSLGGRVTAQERVQLTSQLAMMTNAGVAVSSALKSITRQCHKPALRAALDQVQNDVLGGVSLSVALAKHPSLFADAYVATIAAGESSGRMSEVLKQLAELQSADLRLRRTLRGMLIYPVLLTAVSAAVIAILIVFVLPRFASIFEQYEITLPLVTRVLIGFAEEIRQRWWVWAPLAAAAIGGLIWLRTTPAGRRLSDTAVLRCPGLRALARTLIGARACRLMGLLITSGVPLLECLGLLRKAISNSVFQSLVDRLEEAVTNGRALSEALQDAEALPPSAAELIATAERTGRLGDVTQMMGLHYEEEGEALARQAISAVEPIVTVVMGAVVATVVLAVMLPVFDIASIAQR